MLIFIYNFHLSDIMASSGLLSKADKLKSSPIALKSTMQKVFVGQDRALFSTHHRVLMVMNECIFMCAQTHMYVSTFNHVILSQPVL